MIGVEDGRLRVALFIIETEQLCSASIQVVDRSGH